MCRLALSLLFHDTDRCRQAEPTDEAGCISMVVDVVALESRKAFAVQRFRADYASIGDVAFIKLHLQETFDILLGFIDKGSQSFA